MRRDRFAIFGWLCLWSALIIGVVDLAACPHPTPGPGAPHGIVQCGTEAVQACAPSALPAVNECLSGSGDVTSCLLGLIQPAGCVTYEVIACLVRHEGSAAEHAYQANPQDTRDHWRAQRAREFLEGQRVQFNDGG
jgi:hypothetical protein